jgi:hypothetical protein
MCKEPDVLVEGHRREANIAEENTKFINMCWGVHSCMSMAFPLARQGTKG